VETIKRLEKMNGRLRAQEETLYRIRATIQSGGVVFVDENDEFGDGPGVRLGRIHNQFVKELADEIKIGVESVLSDFYRDKPSLFELNVYDFSKYFVEDLGRILPELVRRYVPIAFDPGEEDAPRPPTPKKPK
jgi:hypothetical protein